MRRCFGTQARNIKAAIGPGIHSCCYEVGPEVRQQFESQFEYTAELFREVKESDPIREKYPLLFLSSRAPGHTELPRKVFLDLVEANRQQIIAAGVSARNISASPLCTACRTDLLFSHRAERGITGRSMAAAAIRPRSAKTTRRRRSWTCLPAVLLSCIVVAQLSFGAESVSAQKIDDIFAGLRSADAPGAAVLVINDGKPVYIFPDFQSYGNSITIRNLLNHTSGLLDYEDLMPKPYGSTKQEGVAQIQDSEAVDLLKKQKRTKFAPGSRWDYSNSGYVVLGQIVEKVSGESFGDFLHPHLRCTGHG